MAYTAPTTRSTGDLITASIWNTDLVDNIIYLKDEVDGAGPIASLTAAAAVTTDAETNLISFTLPGGTLGDTGGLYIKLIVRAIVDSSNAVVKLKLGSTTLVTSDTITFDAGGGGTRVITFEATIRNLTASSQLATLRVEQIRGLGAAWSATANGGTGSEATASDKTVSITWDGNASPSDFDVLWGEARAQ